MPLGGEAGYQSIATTVTSVDVPPSQVTTCGNPAACATTAGTSALPPTRRRTVRDRLVDDLLGRSTRIDFIT